MPDIDVSGYVDLTPFDLSAVRILTAARDTAALKLPGYQWVENDVPTVLLEAFAHTIAELGFVANRLPSALATLVGGWFGVTYDPGAPASFTAIIDAPGLATPLAIPGGALVELDVNGTVIQFASDAAVTITPPATSVAVSFTARRTGAAPNTVPVGTVARVVDALPQIQSITLATSGHSGRDPETSDAYLARVVATVRTQSAALVLPSAFEAFALAQPGVARAHVIDLYDPTQPWDNGATKYPGHTTVVVAGPDTDLDPAVIDNLTTAMQTRAAADKTIHIIGPSITTVAVTVTVHRTPTADAATVEDRIVSALSSFLSRATWPWSTTVRRNDLIALVDQVPGVDYVDSLTPGADVTLTGPGPLALLGPVTVTVL